MIDSRISVVIPTYNRARLIRRAVESVLAQTTPADEIIVIDDGSKDDTAEQVRIFGDHIRYIPQANAGASESRNRGVREAQYPWVAFLDSDDVWRSTHLELMGKAIRATDGRAWFYFADMEMAPEDGGGTLWQMIGLKIHEPFEFREDPSDWVIMSRQPTMLQSSVFFKPMYLSAGGLWKALRLTHDTHLFLKLGIHGPACAVAGVGTVQTADDQGGNRLTAIFNGATRAHWEECVTLWKDLVHSSEGVRPAIRKQLAGYLAMAHWRLSRIALAEHKPAESAAGVLRSVAAKPDLLPTVIWKAVGRRRSQKAP